MLRGQHIERVGGKGSGYLAAFLRAQGCTGRGQVVRPIRDFEDLLQHVVKQRPAHPHQSIRRPADNQARG